MDRYYRDREKHTFVSNAKVSIYTDIVGKEDDRWVIEAIIIPIALYDNIEVHLNSKNIINVKYKTEKETYVSQNCQLAIQDLIKLVDGKFGVNVLIRKRIPISSGLGGESANVMTILQAVNIMADLEVPICKLMDISGKYGNDAFFFSYNKPAYIIKRTMIPLPINNKIGARCFIIDPQIYIAEYKTKEILGRKLKINNDLVNKEKIVRAWNSGDLRLMNAYLQNFIIPDIVPEYCRAYEIAEDVYELTGYKPQFTGTGPCMILLVNDVLEKQLTKYCNKNNVRYYVTRIL